MNNKRSSGYIIGGIVILLGIFLIVTYNGLVKKEEQVKLQWNEVQNAYQRRIDLIPNVVNVVKGQANFEQTTLQQLTEARAKATAVTVSSSEVNADKFKEQMAAQDGLAAATNRLLITVEKYPELQGAAAFKGLQTQLEGTERRIKVARKDFNDAIQDYNSSVRSFPTKLVAGVLGFEAREGFQSDAGAERAVEIKF
ncbi:LemA family protein [Ferruginibacter paludis]|uniref:LemA family protein n=1 Tax=Ferruginibacter paludis TaxID=1310417 RepID=UPI0025B62510|nr:LemA family protein [Ferruginibacter paludis]MDN3658788.1 LemA family protein [Ferruginibacter paludis]